LKPCELAIAAVIGCLGAASAAAEDAAPESRLRLRMQSVLEYTREELVENALFNPDNAIARRPAGQLSLELRPDLEWSYGRLALVVRPRARFSKLDGVAASQESNVGDDLYVNTWKLKAALTPTLSLSYGREVLQWGNGTLRSLSNPFFVDTGKLNPIRELAGQDFLSASFAPTPRLSFTLLDNTGGGRRAPGALPFARSRALKIDYVGDTASAGLILSKARSRPVRLGSYLTYAASDATLLYAESTLAQGSEGFYPQRSADGIGWTLQQSARDSDQLFYSHLIGAAYSLEGGATFTLEYLHNNEGYDSAQARELSSLALASAAELSAHGPEAQAAAGLLGRSLEPNLRLLRQDYLFVQFFKGEYRERADIALRYTRGVADQSSSWSTSLVLNAGERLQLFFIGSYNRGERDAELARLHRYTLFAGLRYFAF
jgi:hypothetical protein